MSAATAHRASSAEVDATKARRWSVLGKDLVKFPELGQISYNEQVTLAS